MASFENLNTFWQARPRGVASRMSRNVTSFDFPPNSSTKLRSPSLAQYLERGSLRGPLLSFCPGLFPLNTVYTVRRRVKNVCKFITRYVIFNAKNPVNNICGATRRSNLVTLLKFMFISKPHAPA